MVNDASQLVDVVLLESGHARQRELLMLSGIVEKVRRAR